MKLHENKKLFEDAVLATAQSIGISEIFVEKDYWVTLALYSIFNSKQSDQAVFKGGTALSKCYKLIERFSEDIDIVILKDHKETDNQLKTKLKSICRIVEAVLPEVEIQGLTNKKGNIRKTVHSYAKSFKGFFGQVKDHVVLEVTWLGSSDPNQQMALSSYVSDQMISMKQDEIIEKYNMQPFPIQVLDKTRIFCEKIMSLVRFSQQGKDPYSDLANKIRHIYDIHIMLKNKEISSFYNGKEFSKMLNKVGSDDVIGYKNDNQWLAHHPSHALIFSKPEETWNKIRTTYNTTFKDLVIGELPKEADVIDTLKVIEERLAGMDWNVKL